MFGKNWILGFAVLTVLVRAQSTFSGTLYGVGNRWWDDPTAILIRINTATGAGTEVGPLGLDPFSQCGLAHNPTKGVLYGVRGYMLAEIDPVTGKGTQIATLNVAAVDPGLAFDPYMQTLYMTEEVTDSLYKVNTSTGNCELVGPLNWPSDGHTYDLINSGLAFTLDPDSQTPNPRLYGGSQPLVNTEFNYDGYLYEIDTATANVTIVSHFGMGVNPHLGGLAFDPEIFDPANPVFYGANPAINPPPFPDSHLYYVSQSGSSFIGAIGYPLTGGLAVAYDYSGPVVAEPSTVVGLTGLLGMGLICHWWRRRKAA